MDIHEVEINEEIIDTLISLSKAWEEENNCHGYSANKKKDIEENRVFLAEEDGKVLGYLFGKVHESKNMDSIMPERTPYFEVEEIYVIPSHRREGIGTALFRYAEKVLRCDAHYMVLSTATKNWKAVFHFYLDELNMSFWSARLFKEI